ncbi:MAG: deoxyribodipyrimidine photolyase [Polyangiales bacterium]
MKEIPGIRVRRLNDAAPVDGGYVLYWMVAFRRPRWNFALQHAARRAHELGKPLVILEALRAGYPWASDRLHRFVLDGMRVNRAHLAQRNVVYFPYVEPAHGVGRGLLATLAAEACLVVSDDYPSFFIPRMQRAAAAKIGSPLELVDSNGLLPLRASEKVFSRAFDFRRFLHRVLPVHLEALPAEDPLVDLGAVPEAFERNLRARVAKHWPEASIETLAGETLASLPIDHSVAPVDFEGGFVAGEQCMFDFLDGALSRYAEDRSHPDEAAASGLSPWLHFGHVSVHQVFDELAKNEGWSIDHVAEKVDGAREGWWGMSTNAEAFLDELVTWREVGFNMSSHDPRYDKYESLPAWARESLELHEADPRKQLYSLEQLELSATHDAVWNAAQTELRQTGRLQNYLRMLWGKRILEWTPNAREALRAMIELNNKYAVDGRDPNSYSGIFWVLGRYDRAWGPERPIFGKIRYMSSANTMRKLRMSDYMARFGGQAELFD